MNLEPGQRIGDYEILEGIGHGGMGRVYKVRNTLSQRVEAMKVVLDVLSEEQQLLDRFLREIRVLASLDHPNIARLNTAFRQDGRIFMIMEFVEGQPLDKLLKDRRLSLEEVVRTGSQVLDALVYAHGRGVIHRDVKPANVILDPFGVAHLTDFGIALARQDQKLTQTGSTVGSLRYTSPEQIAASPNLDARTDLYSLGVTLYEMATGQHPYSADSDYQMMAAHIQQPPRPPIEIDPSLPAPLSQIILMAMQKAPAHRFQSAEAMGRALAQVIAKPTPVAAAIPSAPAPQSPTPQSRRALYILAGSLATIAVLVLGAIQLPKWMKTSADEPQTPATAVSQPTPEPQQPAPALVDPPQTVQQPVIPGTPVALPPRPVPRPAPTTRAQAPSSAPTAQQQAAPVPVPSTPTTAVSQPQQAPGPPLEVRKARDRMMTIATRTGAIRTSLGNLKRSQAAMGLGVRSDFTSAETRLVYLLDEAEAALKSGDAASANQNLDQAELSLQFLESRLGK